MIFQALVLVYARPMTAGFAKGALEAAKKESIGRRLMIQLSASSSNNVNDERERRGTRKTSSQRLATAKVICLTTLKTATNAKLKNGLFKAVKKP